MRVSERALQALLDKHSIYEVLARYARAIDRRDPELLRSVFHADATDHHVGRATSAAEFCGWAMKVLERVGPTAHCVGFPLVELHGDVAYSECYAIAFHRLGEGEQAFDDFLGARLLDRFEKRGGEWRIAHRRVVYDWSRDIPAAETWGRGAFGAIVREARPGRSDPLYELLEGRT
jgi:hypothetical protein